MNAKLLCVLLLIGAAADAQTINYSITTQKASSAYVIPTIAWSTTPAGASCTAGGHWWGSKPAAGSVTLAAISGSRTYNLRCIWPVSGSTTGVADLSWDAPTLNTDGSLYANPFGYVIRYGTPPTMLTKQTSVTPYTLTARRVESLAPATWGFCVNAVSALGAESQCSSVATKVVTASASPVERRVGLSINSAPTSP